MLSGILSGILYDIYSGGILDGIYFDIISDTYSESLSGIQSDSLFGIMFSRSFWQLRPGSAHCHPGFSG